MYFKKIKKKKKKMLTCNRLDLEHQDLNRLCPKMSTDTASISKQIWDMWVL